MSDGILPRAAPGTVPRLIAHRGYPLHYPENSLAGFHAALAAGATAVECDLQLSADHQPMIIHDADLQRTAGVPGDVRELTGAELAGVEVNEPARLGARFHGTRIPRLQELVALARTRPALEFFLDVKRASLRRFGNDAVLDAVLSVIDAGSPSWVIVSFDRGFLERSRHRCAAPIGWVVERPDIATLAVLRTLEPDYAFCAARNLPIAETLPRGNWQWVIYGVDDPALALELGARGADCVETDAIGELLASPLLRPSPS